MDIEKQEHTELEMPREKRTPITEAAEVILKIDKYFFNSNGKQAGFWFENIYKKMFQDETTSGDLAKEDFFQSLEEEEEEEASEEEREEEGELVNFAKFPPLLLHMLFIATAYAIQAVKAQQSDNPEENQLAWSYACDAQFWLGSAVGERNLAQIQKILKEDQVEKAAAVRHAENRAIKQDALEYYATNIDKFKSMDHAAEQIAGKIVNARFRTVRNWITQYHKKLRSTGTA